MIKAIFIDFYGTVVYEDGEVVSKISRIICETGNAISSSEIDAYWWNRFKTLFENSYGENFETQRALELKSLLDTITHFESSADGVVLSNEMFEYWVKPPIFESRSCFSKTARCRFILYLILIGRIFWKPLLIMD